MRAARVVADHSSEGAISVSGRVGTPNQLLTACLHRCIAQLIANRPREYAGPTLRRVHLEDAVHVFRPVDNNGDIAALTGQAGTSPSREQRGTKFPSGSDGLHHVFLRS